MAANNRRYFWMKLKEDFFEEKVVRYLLSLPNGSDMVLLFLKMQLKSLNTDGVIYYDGCFPTVEEELSIFIGYPLELVTATVTALERAKAVDRLDDGSLIMVSLQELIGSESADAERKRKARGGQCPTNSGQCPTNSGQCPTNSGQCPTNSGQCPTDIDIHTDTHIHTDREGVGNSAPSVFGEYKNVLLSDEELAKLKAEFSDWEERIERLSSYIASTGKKYKSHLATIRNWARNDKPKVDRDYGDPEDFYK